MKIWHETKPREWTGVLCGRVYTLSQNDTDLLYRVFYKGSGLAQTNSKKKTQKSLFSNETKEYTSSEQTSMECIRGQASSRSQAGHNTVIKTPKDKDIICHRLPSQGLSAPSPETESETMREDRDILCSYFQLGLSLKELYSQWSSVDGHFKCIAEKYTGIRQLRQDPVENLFSFICSSNNNITRISSMVEKMCEHYGQELALIGGQMYYAFPTIEALAGPDVEETLRKLGFGYRAKYISQTARHIHTKHSAHWLYDLRNKPYEEARRELLKLCGVGPKVSDCVCLMSLDKHNAVPIDTHVFQFALRDYSHYPAIAKHRGVKSVTDKVYKDIGDFFRTLWGDYAGWAQSVLFSAELPQFQESSKTIATVKVKRTSGIKDEKITQKKKKK